MKFGHMFWILDEQRKVKRVGLLEWGRFFGDNRELRIVGKTEISGLRVSTVFLGIDHSWIDAKQPVLWETMVFGDVGRDFDMDRCAGTWEQAEEMHERMCARVREALGVMEKKR